MNGLSKLPHTKASEDHRFCHHAATGGDADCICGASPSPREVCEDYAGHEWAPAGGGMLICMRCELERWDDEVEGNARG